MADVLVDTDVFIDHLRGARRLNIDDDDIWYSVVTRCELWAGTSIDETALAMLLSSLAEVEVDRKIAERAGRVRRETGTRIADALIAATALERGLVLVTRNVRHFERVVGLEIRAPR